MIHGAAEMPQSVGEQKISGSHRQIVSRGLIEQFLRDGHVRRFAFNNHQGLHGGIVTNDVAAA